MNTRYDGISRLFHWLMAVLIVWQGLKFFDYINDGKHWIGENLVPWHVSIGTLLLVLIIARLIWLWLKKDQRPQPVGNPMVVKLGHGLLYLCMFLLPVAGISKIIGHGYPLKAFGVELVAKSEGITWLASFGSIHAPLAWLFFALVAGHIAVALYHQIIKHDDVMHRII